MVNETSKLIREQTRDGDAVEVGRSFDMWNLETYTKERVLIGLAFTCLVLATAGERFVFKYTVDTLTPYRLVVNIMVLLTSMIVYGAVAFYKYRMKAKSSVSWSVTKGFSHINIMKMALLDAIQFSGLIVSAAGVSPTMTVILLHANTPFVVLGSRLMFDGRVYSASQVKGVLLIACAVVVSFYRPFLHLFRDGNVPFITSSLCYVAFIAVQGFAMLFKEKCIIEHAKPLDVHELSFWLFFYQLIITVILSPAIYCFQGVSSEWVGFPLSSFADNIKDGFRCMGGTSPPLDVGYDTEYLECGGSLALIMSYSLCTIMALFSVGIVLQRGNQALGRAMFLGVFFAIIALAIYDTETSFGSGFFGSDIGTLELVSFVCLLTGMETYYYDPEPDGQVMTNYVPRR